MSTRFRAISVTTLITALLFLVMAGVVDLSTVTRLWFGSEDPVLVNVFGVILISILLAVGVWWVIFFKYKGGSLFAIGFFPSVALMPIILFSESLLSSIFKDIDLIPLAFLASIFMWFVIYLLILTANVLNGAVLYSIPLGQAGKASQFIFSLISTYFLVAFLFGAVFPLEVRIPLILVFTFYFAYSAIWTLQVPSRQVLISAIAITLSMSLVTILISIWPISSVYASLSIVVIFYIMLNVALEMREKISKMIWVEYALLILLLIIILFANGNWGINGSLI